ncbi:hypothetical protein K2173_019204 [Erythroxylum novogranatense]|uniref:Uncharacterized protein n=1 Tax=Erythroxylum novogranatense TaxID=1862640 RepID=A0AAV8SSZ2_9ROSI|nr:hypothetical protein K2173_019204 [Erythroxylum novogranatense]
MTIGILLCLSAGFRLLPLKSGRLGGACDESRPQGSSVAKHHFRMEDGVIHVYADEHDTSDLFLVVNATTFFY